MVTWQEMLRHIVNVGDIRIVGYVTVLAASFRSTRTINVAEELIQVLQARGQIFRILLDG